MKPLNQKYKSLSSNLKKLSRRQFIIFTLLLLAAVSYSGLKISQPTNQIWDDSAIQLPNPDQLQQYIDEKITSGSDIDQQLNNNLDNIIDHQAMQAKLSGLTKNITLTRAPTNQELADFYTQYSEQYRKPSTFHFSQYLFPNTQHGGQAVNAAQKILDTPPANRDQPTDSITLNSLQVDRLYGVGFSKKLLNEVNQSQQELPCWEQPITSKVGAHLICFKKVSIGAIPELASIRPQLINHWRYETAKKQLDRQ